MDLTTGILPTWIKQILAIGSLLLTLAGIPAVFGFVCITLMLVISEDSAAIVTGLASFTLIVLTVGAGGVAFWHSTQSLQDKISKPVQFPLVWILLGIFGLLIIIGLMIIESETISGILLPPILFGITLLPSFIALSWFVNNKTTHVTYRQGLVAFAGGITVSTFLTFLLVGLVITIALALVNNFAISLFNQIDNAAVSGPDSVMTLLSGWNYVYVFILVAFIIPIAAELCKPLVTLPILGRLSSQDAFLIGSAAGTGFAMMSNLVVAGWGLALWNGTLVILLLGGAINPFCTGFVTLGWYRILQKNSKAWSDWATRLCIAVIIHAAWNSGSFLLLTVGDNQHFGNLFWGVTPIGVLAVGAMLAMVVILGLGAYQMGQVTTEKLAGSPPVKLQITMSGRIIAMWALACLIIIVPTGLVWLHFLSR
jgi:hypothetical protein